MAVREEQLMPRDLVYPPGKSRDEIDKANDADFKESEHNAEFAALGYLKYPQAIDRRGGHRSRALGGQAAGR